MEPVDKYIEKVKVSKKLSNRIKGFMPVLSLVVIASVFWTLKLTGITMAGEAFCGKEEHIHDENCGSPPIICQLTETEGHFHTESCITNHLVCTTAESEGHVHGEECYSAALICTIEKTDGHTHNADCYLVQTVCQTEEHQHNDECIAEEIGCDREENSEHSHTEECYVSQIICDLEEHVHSEQCQTEELICELEETEAHHHVDECYALQLICTTEEADGHIHSEECYVKGSGFVCQSSWTEEHIHTAECVGEETELFCGKEFTLPHTHTESCYGIAEECLLKEHIHVAECYSDINADLETQSQWEETLAGIIPNARPQDNIVAVAYSQLGYTESEKNFEVDEDGNKNGYTRYGQWYGNPYGQWNTMFVSFCLHYSQLEGIPLSAGAETMRIEWENVGIFVPKDAWQPMAGDLIFLDKNINDTADAVAIVTGFAEGQISVIEGDMDGVVAETTYTSEDITVMGYGVIPDMNAVMTLEERVLTTIAYSQNYTGQSLNNNRYLLYTQSGNNYYAIDGDANAVQIFIDNAGNITADVNNISTLLWRFESTSNYDNQPAYYIQNVATGKYLHPYQDSNTNRGAILDGRWESALYLSNNGFRVRGARQNAYLQLQNNRSFTNVGDLNSGSLMYLGRVPDTCTVWLDGTNGGVRLYGGSPDTSYTFFEGQTFNLPTEWQSPTKYSQKLQGWYDVTNGVYYPLGAEVTVTGNMVFYADWVAETYDIGQYNEHTVNTVSSNQFITTKIFDYSYLFNVMSANPSVTVSDTDHSETWSMVTGNNTVKYKNATTLDYIFLDWTGGGRLAQPNNMNSHNGGSTSGVKEGIVSGDKGMELIKILFSTDNLLNPETGEGVIGKTYLGEGDHLFQYASDPSHPYYGYYYYDSRLNAAAYNQSAQRFYVYDYLSATSDSIGNSSYSDYLPLNSPYANTGENNVGNYTYAGDYGEYNGTTHHRYEIGYSDAGNAMVNMAFGTSIEVKFHLPNKPGELDADGEYGNKDLYGKEMNFEFIGDDDLWVFVDGQLILDLGGIHGAESGSINFSTGVVTVNGNQHHTITDMPAGEHTLQIYYLERGSSQSNCSMYFNLAPRFSLNIQKEDVLSQQLLNGAEFAVYTDSQCTSVAELWTSESSYQAGHQPAKKFTVVNGTAEIWGFSAGNTYYIKEVKPPDEKDYDLAKGIIRFSIDKRGLATYGVEIQQEIDAEGNKIPVSPGFTVHGVRIDEENQKAYIVVTNAQNWVKETTTVQAVKIWGDDIDHSEDYVTVYLTVTDSDGTVRRIREILLSDENNWSHLWTGLPKYAEDEITEIDYGVDEAYEEGYYSSSMEVDRIEIDKSEWAEAVELENNKKYLLSTSKGYLSTTSENATNFKWVDEYTAQHSPLAQWNAIVNKNQVQFTNDAGQIITLNTSGGTKYAVNKSSGSNQSLTITESGSGLIFRVTYRNRNYYMGDINASGGAVTAQTNSNNAMVFVPMTLVKDVDVIEIKDLGFKITNTPLDEETSVTVNKVWSVEGGYGASYREELVTVKLLADGVDTGRTVTLMLKNNWTDTFRGLPYKDENGVVINYSVEEVWKKRSWVVSYGPIITNGGNVPTYSTTVTNTYIPMGPALPTTGSFARLAYIYCGGSMMLISLIAAIRLRRKKERRNE